MSEGPTKPTLAERLRFAGEQMNATGLRYPIANLAIEAAAELDALHLKANEKRKP